MRDVDERVAAVQGRVRRMKRKRDRATVSALGACTMLVLACAVGMPLVDGRFDAASGGATLFGASSLFGPSVGGYVLVAIVTAVVVALVTVLCVTRRRSGREKGDASETMADTIGARPEGVTIRPLVEGEESTQSPIDVTAENGWQCSFGKLSLHVDNEKDVVPKVRNDFANDGEKPS